MRKVLHWVSLLLFAALSLFLLAFGALYASVGDMLPFHAAAVPAMAREAVRPLYFALMALIGAASIGLGALGLYVTFGPMRAGMPLAAPMVAGAYAAAFIGAAMVAERLASVTGAPTSWHIMGVLLALTIAALAMRLYATRLGKGGPS